MAEGVIAVGTLVLLVILAPVVLVGGAALGFLAASGLLH